MSNISTETTETTTATRISRAATFAFRCHMDSLSTSEAIEFARKYYDRVNAVEFRRDVPESAVEIIYHTDPECGGNMSSWAVIVLPLVDAEWVGNTLTNVVGDTEATRKAWIAHATETAEAHFRAGDNGSKWASRFTYLSLPSWASESLSRIIREFTARRCGAIERLLANGRRADIEACYRLGVNPLPRVREIATEYGVTVRYERYWSAGWSLTHGSKWLARAEYAFPVHSGGFVRVIG